MRGLTIVVAGPDRTRCRTALAMAATQRALGGAARLFFDGPAVTLAHAPVDDEPGGGGLPTLAELWREALDAGARVVLCQSGLAAAGLDASRLDARFEAGGMVGVLQTLGDDRLVVI